MMPLDVPIEVVLHRPMAMICGGRHPVHSHHEIAVLLLEVRRPSVRDTTIEDLHRRETMTIVAEVAIEVHHLSSFEEEGEDGVHHRHHHHAGPEETVPLPFDPSKRRRIGSLSAGGSDWRENPGLISLPRLSSWRQMLPFWHCRIQQRQILQAFHPTETLRQFRNKPGMRDVCTLGIYHQM
mmetsp:Transcript_16340/g.46697  ORF Transcript_16340/g.46697 Transcript_16340/m.46697 type:complete len:181 (-) Transcript_16340:548-1090(-)